MFESAELGRKISKKEFENEVPELRRRLILAQYALREAKQAVVVMVAGVDGAGKAESVHRINEWLDPRWIDTHSFWKPVDVSEGRPPYWIYWRALPPRGRMAIFFGSWYTEMILRRAQRKLKTVDLDDEVKRITFFENMLAEDGVLIVKLWYHLSEEAQGKRLKKLEKDPKTSWRVLPTDWQHHRIYGRLRAASERVLRQTDTVEAPWYLIEAGDWRYRDLTTGRLLLESFERQVELMGQVKGRAKPVKEIKTGRPGAATILDQVDLTLKLGAPVYRRKLANYQAKLNRLTWKAHEKGVATVVVLEGWDAAGKGGCIRRTTAAMDSRLYRVVPISVPTDEELAHHYLWRFWRHLPKAGRMTLFDRSWYGRVLVERMEGFATEAEWRRAYQEINNFEEQLVDHGVVLVKFWLHVSAAEQLARFREREKIPFKRHKLTPDDWRNRKKWKRYETAVNDMVSRTSSEYAPWTLVAANNKKHARVTVLKTICARLEEAVG